MAFYNPFRSFLRRITMAEEADAVGQKSPKLLATPLQSRSSIAKFTLSSADYSSSSSSSSTSSASSFWISPRSPSRWSPKKYIPAKVRSIVTKRQVAVVVCLVLALVIWVVPPPQTWGRRVVHITIPQPATSPYQVLRPSSPPNTHKNAPDPLSWLEKNSNNKYTVTTGSGILGSVGHHISSRPRAALISLVRNSELPGLMQSMRQLEYHWNRKYQYPWIFFNDEPFSDEFKVSRVINST